MEFFETFKRFLDKLFEFPVIKIMAGIFISLLSNMYGEMKPAYVTIIIFVIADWISALWFAWVDPDSCITSNRMRTGIIKILIYALALSAGHFCSYISALAAFEAYIQGFIVTTELISLFENAKKLDDHYGWKCKFLDVIINFLHGKRREMERSVGLHDQKRVRSEDDDCRPAGTESRGGF